MIVTTIFFRLYMKNKECYLKLKKLNIDNNKKSVMMGGGCGQDNDTSNINNNDTCGGKSYE